MTKKMDIFLQNKYSKCYFRIIEKAKNRKLNNVYVEKHHVFPKSMGGDNSLENLVLLTAKEHFICHLLLPKSVMPEYKKKMNYAFWRMCNVTEKRYKPSARFYSLGKQAFVDSHTGHPPYLISHSEESRNLISIGMKKALSFISTEEMKERMLNSCCNPDVYTKERADKISKSTTGVKKTKTPKLLQAEQDRKERCIAVMIRCAMANKGRTWRLVNGKRVWMDKETQNY